MLLLKRLFRIIFPIFNWGTAVVLQSWWWASDRLSIIQTPQGGWLLKGRRRDLKVIRDVLAGS